MSTPTARKPEQPGVTETPFASYELPATNLYGSATVPTYSNFRFEGSGFYQQSNYNSSIANFNYQISESRGHDYYNPQTNTLQERQFYDEPFGFGTTYGYAQQSQRSDPLPAITYGYGSIRM